MVSIHHFHRRGHGFYPWSRNYDPSSREKKWETFICSLLHSFIQRAFIEPHEVPGPVLGTVG